MIESLAAVLFFGFVGILLFLPYLAISWERAKEGENEAEGDERPETQ